MIFINDNICKKIYDKNNIVNLYLKNLILNTLKNESKIIQHKCVL